MSKIIREKKTENFSIISNQPLQEIKNLDTLGLLVYLLSKPNDWSISTDQLTREKNAGIKKIRRIINELIDLGYMKRHKYLEGRTWKTDYIVSEKPHLNEN